MAGDLSNVQTRPTDGNSYRVLVVELADSAGPRRRADRPNLYLGITSGDPTARFDQMRRSKGSSIVREHGSRLRADLTQNYPATTQADVDRQMAKIKAKLMKQGYTVNGDMTVQRDATVWHVYVIELADGARKRAHPDFPWVYVGETSIDPDDRFLQHMQGARNHRGPLFSRVVHNRGICLRPDLSKHEPALYTAEESKKAEKRLAAHLSDRGYSVEGGH